MKEGCCESCGSTESLIESGGQFCGGTWYLCKKCDDEAIRAAAYYNQLFKSQREKRDVDIPSNK